MIGFIGSAGLGVVSGGAGSAPTVQSHDIVFSSVTDVSFTVSFTNGDGNGRLILIKSGAAVDATPDDGINYNANSVFGSGDELGTGNFAVFSGAGTSVTVTGLTLNTTYHVRIFEYNQPSFSYLTITATDNPKSQITTSLPSIQANTLSFSDILTTSETLSWIRGNGANVLVVARAGSAVNANPSDNTTYTGNAAFGSGTQIGTGNYVVYKGTGTSVNVTGLTVGVIYHFKVYEFGGGAGSEKYLTADAFLNPNSQATDYLGATLIDEWISNYGLTLRVNNGDYLDKWTGYRNGTIINRSGNVPKPIDGVFSFDASGVPNLSSAINVTQDVTFCFLIQKSALTGSTVTLLTANSDTPSLRIHLETSNVDPDMGITLAGVTYLSGANFTYDGDFHVVCFSISPGNAEFKVFLDGAQVGSTQTIPGTALNLNTTNAKTFFSFQYVGQAKKIRIYNEAVDATILNAISDPDNPFATTMVEHRPARCYGFWGQSNMVGSGLVSSDYASYLQPAISGVTTFETFARYPFQAGVHPVQAGPEIKCMYDLAEAYPDYDLFIVKNASANKSLAVDFRATAPVGTLYTNFVNAYLRMVNTLEAEGRVIIERSFFGMQGEEDATDLTQANEYEQNLTDFNTNFRTATGALKHVYGRLHDSLPTTGSNARPYANTVRTAQTDVADADDDADYVNTDDGSTGNFELKADSVHFNAVGETKLGEFFALQLLALLPEDYTEWTAATSVDDQPTGDADFFWHNPEGVGIRASLQYTGTAYSIETVDGREYYKLYIDPDTPDPSPNDSNYRAEIQRHTTTKPPDTVRMVGSGFMFPEILNHGGEIIIGQLHTGTGPNPPYDFNHPVIYLGLAYQGQVSADENELVVVNKVKAFETASHGRTNTGIVIAAGTEYFMRQYIIGGNPDGYYRLDLKIGRGGTWTTIYEENESTIWADDEDGGSNALVTPYWKTGIYAQNISTAAEVASEKALNGGVYNITMYLLDKIKTADMLTDDPLYSQPVSSIIKCVDTSI